nr:cache domain-containing protein [uncultured Vibrio sp.]
MFTSVDHKVKALVNLIRTDYIAAQKESIETQVLQVSQQITHTQRLIESETKKRITRRLDRAYTAARNIYSSNQHLPQDELKLLILNEIRKLSYAKEKGYIYAYDMQGNLLVHPLYPELENTNQLEETDIRGVPVIKEQIDLLKATDGAYSRYFALVLGLMGRISKSLTSAATILKNSAISADLSRLIGISAQVFRLKMLSARVTNEYLRSCRR